MDRVSGLGPDQMKRRGNGRRWMEMVDKWELGGGQGDVPPGMGEPGLERFGKSRLYPNATSDLR